MELDEALQSDLLALRQLYGLLQSIIGYHIPNISIENVCKLLDKKALQLLKNLLDDAKQRLFKSTHSEIFKADHDQSSIFNAQATKLNAPHENIISGKDSNSHTNTSPRDEQRSIKPQVVSEFSKLSFPSNQVDCKRKQSQIICKQITEKTKVPISNEKAIDQSAEGSEKTRKRIGCEMSNPSSSNIAMSSVGCSSSFVSINSTNKKSNIREINDFSKEVTKAIKQIDSHILALQLVKSSNAVKSNNDTSLFETLMGSKMSRHVAESTWGNESLSQLASQVYGSGQNPRAETISRFSGQNNVKAMVDRIESPSQSASGTNQRTSYVHGLRVPLSQDDPTVKKETIGNTRSESYMPSDGHDEKLSQRLNRESNTRKEKKPSRQIIMRPTLLDHTDNQRRNKPRRKTILSPIETSSSPYPSSSTDLESESGSYLAPSSTEDDESEQRSSSSYERSGPSTRTETKVSRQRRDSKKGIGRLRRIKNKLGFIFHHQHHHHHHHHHHSNWKLLQKIFHSKKKRENHKHGEMEAAANNLKRKSVVKSNMKRSGQDNVGQFHALVEGLMLHAGGRRSKKPVTGKGGRNKKLVKRIHWWQKFQRRRGVKLPNRRGRVKVGFTSKTPKLKM